MFFCAFPNFIIHVAGQLQHIIIIQHHAALSYIAYGILLTIKFNIKKTDTTWLNYCVSP